MTTQPKDGIDIVAIGEPMLELNERALDGVRAYTPGFGGDTSNFAVAAARQGARVAYYTRLGSDHFGDRLMDLWTREGIDASSVQRDEAAPTGIYFITHTDAGHQFTYYRKASAASLMTPADLPRDLVASARVLHVSGISQAISTSACDTVFDAIDTARTNGVLVSYDPNVRPKLWPSRRARAIVLETVALADYVLPSLEDATLLFGNEPHDAIVDRLLERGARHVALKLGPEGVIVATPDERHHLEGRRVETVDATGAGDTFDGAFITERLRGATLHAAARYANAAAALSTQGYGAVDPIPTRATVETHL